MPINNISIHPGKDRPPRDTSKPWKGKGKLAKKQARLARRRLTHSQTLKTIGAKIPPTAFKAPGSMNPKK